MDTLLAQEGREGFAAAWLRAQHFPEEARYVETFQQRGETATTVPAAV